MRPRGNQRVYSCTNLPSVTQEHENWRPYLTRKSGTAAVFGGAGERARLSERDAVEKTCEVVKERVSCSAQLPLLPDEAAIESSKSRTLVYNQSSRI